jgi:hypothetical protein
MQIAVQALLRQFELTEAPTTFFFARSSDRGDFIVALLLSSGAKSGLTFDFPPTVERLLVFRDLFRSDCCCCLGPALLVFFCLRPLSFCMMGQNGCWANFWKARRFDKHISIIS